MCDRLALTPAFVRHHSGTENTGTGSADSGPASDLALVKLCLGGNDAAWRELVSLHGPAAYRAIARTLARAGRSGVEEADEVYQALLVALFDEKGRRLATYAGTSSLRGWLAAVASRHALDHLRKLKVRRTVPLTDVATPDEGEEPIPTVAAEEIERAIEQLDPLDATVIRLFHFEGLSYSAISKMVGVAINTLCPRITRARARLRKLLAPRMH